jgi:hypothetical protein
VPEDVTTVVTARIDRTLKATPEVVVRSAKQLSRPWLTRSLPT